MSKLLLLDSAVAVFQYIYNILRKKSIKLFGCRKYKLFLARYSYD